MGEGSHHRLSASFYLLDSGPMSRGWESHPFKLRSLKPTLGLHTHSRQICQTNKCLIKAVVHSCCLPWPPDQSPFQKLHRQAASGHWAAPPFLTSGSKVTLGDQRSLWVTQEQCLLRGLCCCLHAG